MASLDQRNPFHPDHAQCRHYDMTTLRQEEYLNTSTQPKEGRPASFAARG
jgi:hypothetical protein